MAWFFLTPLVYVYRISAPYIFKHFVFIYRIIRRIRQYNIAHGYSYTIIPPRAILFIVIIVTFTVSTNVRGTEKNHLRINTDQTLLSNFFNPTEELIIIESPSFTQTEPASSSLPVTLTSLNNQYSTSSTPPLLTTTIDRSGIITQLMVPNTDVEQRSVTISYTVRPGDTISTIAEHYGISINTVLWANKLSLYSIIKPGEELTILPVSGVTHTVKKNDTLSAIAKEYSVNIDSIASANNLVSSNQLRVDQQLIIPGGAVKQQPQKTTRLASLNNIFSPPVQAESTASDGEYLWPLPASRRITQYFNYGHTGIDIGGQPWHDIVSSKTGRIEFAGWSRGYGYNVVINHGDSIKTRYAHMSKLFVKTGDTVEQGDVIGKIGSTGRSTGPHLHFEIMVNNKFTNPFSYL